MNTNYFVFIGLFINVVISVLFPMQIFGEDPLGIESQRQTNFDNTGYFSTKVQQDFQDTGYFTNDGTPSSNDGYFASITNAGDDGGQVTLFGEDGGLGFLDWFRVALNLAQNIFVFVFAFVLLLFALPAPFNFLFGITLGGAYSYSLLRLIMNR